ncbi:MAG: hypothetical protein HQL38_18520 [Alphaproteobacteria bacterium]|nr:hypothetical protein [Alphaproteobacteria bacterium]
MGWRMLPERLAKPLLIWSVVAGLAPFLFGSLFAYAGEWIAAVPWLKRTLKLVFYFTLAQAPLVAGLDVICAIWGCLARPKGYCRSWFSWGLAAVIACFSWVALTLIVLDIESHHIPPPID